VKCQKVKVSNWYDNYWLLFLDPKGDVHAAAKCNQDHFYFVHAKKTFWNYQVGLPVSFLGTDDWEWGEVPHLKKIVWKMIE